MVPEKVFIDTDMGLDVDDAMAITLALRSPEINIQGMSTVWGDTSARARRVIKLVELALGKAPSFPISAGSKVPLARKRSTDWDELESKQLLAESSTGKVSPLSATELLIETIDQHPQEVTVVAIGPLTNIAQVFKAEPTIVQKIKRLIVMGGVFAEHSGLPQVEYNIGSDPEAADIVFNAKCPTTLISLDVTTQVVMGKSQARALRLTNKPAAIMLAHMADFWWNLQGEKSSPMHDPLAVAALLSPNHFKTQTGFVHVDLDSQARAGQTHFNPDSGGHIELVTKVSSPELSELIFTRVCC